MTNKTELLPCPFCGNDELSAEPDTKYVMCHGCDADGPMTKPGDAIKAWNTRAAPAEDVREVVDEPVVYQVKIHGMTLYWNTPSEASKAINTPLYSRPQRKVVMPEFETFQKWMADSQYEHTPYWAWRLCLDEFARLNK